jgi:hypothetical protein
MTGLYSGPSTSIDHNLYIRDNRAYQANYRSGLRILDTTNISAASLNELAFFDVYPVNDAPEFSGAWSNFPFFPSGIVLVGGIEQGVFMLRPTIGGQTLPPSQLVLDESGPGAQQAVALEATHLFRDPFPVLNPGNLLNQGPDKNTRVALFITNLQLVQGEAPSSVIVNLTSSSNESYNLPAEDVRPVNSSNFTQVIFRLPDTLVPGVCAVKVRSRGHESNAGTIRIKS